MNNDEINDLLINGFENINLDFKLKQYKSKNPDLVKDVISMANAHSKKDKFIIFGVNDDQDIIGIDKEEKFVDSATLQEVILQYIEPDITIEYFRHDYYGKLLGVLKILKENENRPYIVKKDLKPLRTGDCFLRKGSMNAVAKREDFDAFYKGHECFEISIMEPSVRAIDDENALAFMEVSIRNFTSRPVTIMSGVLQIINDESDIFVRLPVYGVKEYKGGDFTYYSEPNSEIVGDLHLGITSTQCLQLGLDEYGITDTTFTLTLMFWDSQGNEYSVSELNGYVFARGKFLWKIEKQRKASSKRQRL